MTERHRYGLATLDAELAGLAAPTTPGAMLGLPIAAGSASRLLRGPGGAACLLIAGSDPGLGINLKLRNVEAKAKVRCTIEAPGGISTTVEGAFVCCTASDPQLRRLFLNLMEEALTALGPAPTATALAAWLHRIAALFSRLEQEGRTQLRGLWAELAVMLALGDTELAARRWHSDPADRFDFLAGNFALEVKSCQDFDRVHHFSIEQLCPPQDLDVWLVSIVVRADPQGQSVLDLLQMLELRIVDNSVREELRAMVLASGGSSLGDDDIYRFDLTSALATVRYMAIQTIPRIEGRRPEEVLSVTLQVRCRDVAEVGTTQIALHLLKGET